jgi:LysM repeat protein
MAEKNVSQMQRIVIIKPGDTLSSIAAQYYGDERLADDLARVNGIAINAILTVGTKVRVPRRVTFERKRLAHQPGLGDTATDFPPSSGELPTMTMTAAPAAWYQMPSIWVALGVGAVLAYLLLTPKKTRKK